MEYNIVNEQEFMQKVIEKSEPHNTMFYETYDRLVWDISHKWYPCINMLSKGQYELVDIHNELWAHIYKVAGNYNSSRAKISSWIYLVCESKAGMVKRSFETKKNNIMENEVESLNNTPNGHESENKTMELLGSIGYESNIEDTIVLQEFLLDFIYSLLELIDACTDKERKVYLLKIKGKCQNDIAREAGVSESYIPKVFKRMSKKFKVLYNTLDEQNYISKEERDKLSKDLLGKKSVKFISDKYDLEPETVEICKEILDIIGVYDY